MLPSLEITRQLWQALRVHGSPYLAVTMHQRGVFAHVECWNEHFKAEQVIVCYAHPAAKPAAVRYAFKLAEQMTQNNTPSGVVPCVCDASLAVEVIEDAAGV